MQGTALAVLNACRAMSNVKTVNEEGGGWYRMQSPLRSDSTNLSFRLHITDDEHGGFIDFAADDSSRRSGSLYQLAQYLGIPLPERDAQENDTAVPYRSLAEYADKHGVEEAVFTAAGWKQGEATNPDPNDRRMRPCFIYPVAGGAHHRVRFTDGEKPKFKWIEKGVPACWYGLERAVKKAKELNSPLVIVNGEPSVIVGQHFGVPACSTTRGENGVDEELLAELRKHWDGRVIIAYDCDGAGRAATKKLAAQLKSFVVSEVDMQLGNKGDLADLCRLFGEHTFEHLQSLAKWPVVDKDKQRVEAANRLAQSMTGLKQAAAQGIMATDPNSIIKLAEKAQSEIDFILKDRPIEILMTGESAADQAVMMYESGGRIGPSSGWKEFDQYTAGFYPELYIFMGAPMMGKSILACTLAANFSKANLNGLVFTTETQPKVWMSRTAVAYSMVPPTLVKERRLSPTQLNDYVGALNLLDKRITFGVGRNMNMKRVKEAALKLLDGGHRLDYIIVDSISRLAGDGDNVYTGYRDAFHTAQDIWQELDIPIICTSQIKSREMDSREVKMPTINDAFGGSGADQDAGIITAIYRHEYYVKQSSGRIPQLPDKFPVGTVALRIVKNRDGEDVSDRLITLKYVPGTAFVQP